MSQNQLPELNDNEKLCLDFLRTAYRLFETLEDINPNDIEDFGFSIRAAQNIVLSRPFARLLSEDMKEEKGDTA